MKRRAPVELPKDDPRDALELVSRFVVGGGYRVPVGGRSTVSSSITTEAIAGAVGYIQDPLSRRVAVAVATRGNAHDRLLSARSVAALSRSQRQEAAIIAAMAYRLVVRTLRRAGQAKALDMRQGADRWRLRVIVYDAAVDLIWPEYRKSMKYAARLTKMRAATYTQVYRAASHVLEAALNSGRSEFVRRLWSLGAKDC